MQQRQVDLVLKSDAFTAGGRAIKVSPNTVPLFRRTALYVSAFAFFYLEPADLGPANFASVWKVIALLIVTVLAITNPRFRTASSIVVAGTAYALVSCLNPSLFIQPVETLSYTLKSFYIPAILILLAGIRRRRNVSAESFIRFARHTAVFASLSSLPFVAGILEPLSSGGYDLSLFGLEGRGFSGVFFNSHGASIVMGTAAIVLGHSALQARSIGRFAFYATLTLLSLYCVYATFARTGYVIAAVGLVMVYAFPLRAWKIVFLMPIAGVAAIFALGSIVENDTLMMRLKGENVHTLASGRGGDITSGRVEFWAAAADAYLAGNPAEWVTGVGEYKGQQLIAERVGQHIGAHNEFVDTLLYNGVLGFALFSVFMYHLFRIALSASRGKQLGKLPLALFVSFLIQMFVQGERVVLSELMMVLIIVGGAWSLNEQRKTRQAPVLQMQVKKAV